jgi:hypothetical protein
MASSPQLDFVRRANPDGTTDSICEKCFVIVATATCEADLDSSNRNHKCDPSKLEYLKKIVERFDAVGESTEPVPMKQSLAS